MISKLIQRARGFILTEMFPLSHTYVSTKIVGREDDLLVLGGVIPDLAWFSLPLEGALHNEPKKFFDFVKEKYPSYLDLAWGVRLHSQVGKGADFYSDDEKIGYAKTNGRKIIKSVANVLGIEEGPQALGLAHNFIEAAVDLHLAQKFPVLVETYRQAINEKTIKETAMVISVYLGKDVSLIETELGKLFAFFSPENISKPTGVCSATVFPFLERILRKKLDYKKILSVLAEAQQLTANSFLTFLDETVSKIKTEFLAESGAGGRSL